MNPIAKLSNQSAPQLVLKKYTTSASKTSLFITFSGDEGYKSSSTVKLEQWLTHKTTELKSKNQFSGAANKTVFFRSAEVEGAQNIAVIGLGPSAQFTHETVRQVAAEVCKCVQSEKAVDAVVDLRSLEAFGLDSGLLGQAFAEGFILASYSFNELKSQKTEAKKTKAASTKSPTVTLISDTASKALADGLKRGEIIATSTNFGKRLGDLPGNLMTPTILAQETVKAARGTGLKVTVWDAARIKKERMNSFLGVSLGSDEPPKFIILEYKGAAASKKPICYVGKGLTFDCGGISIKPAAGMEEMKYDMCGGAAVISTMLAIAQLKLKVNAIAFVPATENLAGPSANKPGDVRVARNGVSIEVNNTDAEGRLILADALVYASEQKPAWIVDAATLTGAMVVALGNTHTGYFTRSTDFAMKIDEAADNSGELVWRMPVTDQHAEDMKGTYADLSNLAASRGAGSATAAAFLEFFVDKSIPYAHFDIAGTAWNAGNRLNYNPKKGATGAIVRTFVQMAAQEAQG